jgi:hypothetical protein
LDLIAIGIKSPLFFFRAGMKFIEIEGKKAVTRNIWFGEKKLVLHLYISQCCSSSLVYCHYWVVGLPALYKNGLRWLFLAAVEAYFQPKNNCVLIKETIVYANSWWFRQQCTGYGRWIGTWNRNLHRLGSTLLAFVLDILS